MSAKVTLPYGFSIPAVGFGTWQAKDEVLESAIEEALKVGYRHIDTAAAYENEHVIGKVLKQWIDSGRLKREDIFITTKLPSFGNRPSEVGKYMDESLKKLQLSHVDLYLVHSPVGLNKKEGGGFEPDLSTDLVAIWKEMEKQVDQGKAKFIGVSNFNERQVRRILDIARIRPVTNQVELHIYLQQNDLFSYLTKNNMTLTAYSSLGTPGSKQTLGKMFGDFEIPNILENPVVLDIAKKYNKTPAQVLLRQIVQRGIVVIPKSTNPERIRQNFQISDWSLDDADMSKMAALNKDARILDFKKFLKTFGDHPEYPF